MINDPMTPFSEDEDNEYYTYVDEYGNEYEYDEFFGGLKKAFKKITPKRIIRHVTKPVRLLNPVNLVKNVTKVPRTLIKIAKNPKHINPFYRPKKLPNRIISRPRTPFRNNSPVNVALNRPIVQQPKITTPTQPSQMRLKAETKPKQAGLLGDNKLAVAVGVLVVGGLIFYKMKPTK